MKTHAQLPAAVSVTLGLAAGFGGSTLLHFLTPFYILPSQFDGWFTTYLGFAPMLVSLVLASYTYARSHKLATALGFIGGALVGWLSVVFSLAMVMSSFYRSR